MTKVYSKAYTEVLEILNHFSKEEYNKIPKEKINFYKDNMDKEYIFTINPEIDLSNQKISKEANAVLITLFRDYFANEKQKRVLNNILNENQKKIDLARKEKYNIDNIFNNNSTEKTVRNTEIIEYKENKFKNILNKILRIFHIKK